MNTVSVATRQRNYDVLIGSGMLAQIGKLLSKQLSGCRTAVITDDQVDRLYGDGVMTSLEHAGYRPCKYVFPHGEASKNMDTLSNILDFLTREGITRADCIIALGGGVVGDVAGFAASVYLRGITLVQVPTTLLAAVDSSVGGKTAVNLPAGKNLAGSFYQPSLVICDCDCLSTLPPIYMADGLAESIKYGMIRDAELFTALQSGTFLPHAEKCITSCVSIKSEIVNHDELDKGERQLLNFGHTAGHAVEKLSNLTISHGHAVAIGMVVVTRAAERMGLTQSPCLDKLCAVLSSYDLPITCPFSAEQLAEIALSDKKRMGDTITLIIPERIGSCRLHPIPTGQLADFFAAGLEER